MVGYWAGRWADYSVFLKVAKKVTSMAENWEAQKAVRMVVR